MECDRRPKKAKQVNKEIAKYVDVMIGNEETLRRASVFEIEGNDADLKGTESGRLPKDDQ